MSRTVLGSFSAALALGAAAAPVAAQAAAPAEVAVRVEGPRGTLVDTTLTTTRTAVVKDGDRSHACSGTSAAGALQQATDGDWTASYFRGLGYAADAIFKIRPASANDYWTLWVNNRSSMTGLCDTELERGDQVLLFLCTSGPDFNCTNAPLGLIAGRERGRRQTLRVVSYGPDGSTTPAAGATVSGGADDGQKRRAGDRARDAEGRREHAARHARGQHRLGAACSARPIAAARATRRRRGSPSSGLRNGQRFAAGEGPRALRGRADGLDGGIVELRLTRRFDGRCTAYVGKIDDFVRCPRKGAPWFQAADRERWSYLLPRRLAPGRYTLGVLASDGAGNASKPLTVRFTVAAPSRAAAAVVAAAAPAPAALAVPAAAPRVGVRVVGSGGRTLARTTVSARGHDRRRRPQALRRRERHPARRAARRRPPRQPVGQAGRLRLLRPPRRRRQRHLRDDDRRQARLRAGRLGLRRRRQARHGRRRRSVGPVRQRPAAPRSAGRLVLVQAGERLREEPAAMRMKKIALVATAALLAPVALGCGAGAGRRAATLGSSSRMTSAAE